jgi:hypothetical protein
VQISFCSADFQVCCAAGFQARTGDDFAQRADLEIGGTADLEVCATAKGLDKRGAAPRGRVLFPCWTAGCAAMAKTWGDFKLPEPARD